jgi:very-short-patch-repair endonuclease
MARQTHEERAETDQRAKELRQQMSNVEWRLWHQLKGRQLLGRKFRRQFPIGPYFADFACLDAKLVVEVDGEQHEFQRPYDARRDRLLREHGFRVLRFWEWEIDENIEGVIETIVDGIQSHDPPPASPRRRGEVLMKDEGSREGQLRGDPGMKSPQGEGGSF